MVFVVPPLRARMGYKVPERIPTTYPRECIAGMREDGKEPWPTQPTSRWACLDHN